MRLSRCETSKYPVLCPPSTVTGHCSVLVGQQQAVQKPSMSDLCKSGHLELQCGSISDPVCSTTWSLRSFEITQCLFALASAQSLSRCCCCCCLERCKPISHHRDWPKGCPRSIFPLHPFPKVLPHLFLSLCNTFEFSQSLTRANLSIVSSLGSSQRHKLCCELDSNLCVPTF